MSDNTIYINSECKPNLRLVDEKNETSDAAISSANDIDDDMNEQQEDWKGIQGCSVA